MKSFLASGVALALGVWCLVTAAHAQDANYRSPSLLPHPQANLFLPTASYPAAYPAAQSSAQAGTWTNPGSQQSQLVGTSWASYVGDGGGVPRPIPAGEDDASPSDVKGYGGKGKGHCAGGKGHCAGGKGGVCGPHLHNPLAGVGKWLDHDCFGTLGSMFGHACDSFCGSCWYGSVGGLVMRRQQGDHYYFSRGRFDPGQGRLDIRETDMDWSGGAEVRVGRYLHGGYWALEGVYWGLYPTSKEAILGDQQVNGNLDAILNFDDIDINGRAGWEWADNSDAHRIKRDWEIHNIEVNLINYAGCMFRDGCGNSRLKVNWGLGIRFFRFDEHLQFSMVENNFPHVFDGGDDQLDYDIDVQNNLIGGQFLGNTEYYLNRSWSLLFSVKAGVYANHIRQRQLISSNGNVAVVRATPYWDQLYWVQNSKDYVSFLGEINVGAVRYLSSCWSLGFGYRVVGATGIAFAHDQIPNIIPDLGQVRQIDSNGGLFLHGGYVNLTLNY